MYFCYTSVLRKQRSKSILYKQQMALRRSLHACHRTQKQKLTRFSQIILQVFY